MTCNVYEKKTGEILEPTITEQTACMEDVYYFRLNELDGETMLRREGMGVFTDQGRQFKLNMSFGIRFVIE